MKYAEVKIGSVYAAKVNDRVVPVRVDSASPFGGWNATSLLTSKAVRIRGAQRLRFELERNPATGNWRPITVPAGAVLK